MENTITDNLLDEQKEIFEKEILGNIEGAPEPGTAPSFATYTPPPPPDAPLTDTIIEDEPIDFSTPPPPPETHQYKELSNPVAEAKLRFIISMADHLLAKGYSKLSMEVNEERWRFDEEEIEMLVKAWMPYMKTHGDKIPDWIECAFVTIWIVGKKAVEAISLRAKNKRNQKAASSPTVKREIAKVEAADSTRRHFQIDEDGFYIKDNKGKYLKASIRKEKASIETDFKGLLKDNDINTLKIAFPTIDLTAHE